MTGNAAIGIWYNGVLLDAVGPSAWSWTSPLPSTNNNDVVISGTHYALINNTLVRASTVTEGNRGIWADAQNRDVNQSPWMVLPRQTVSGLGVHSVPSLVCPNNLFKLTCGTLGSANFLPTTAYSGMQIECPSDCTWFMASLAPVLSHNVSSAAPSNPLAGAAVYAAPSPVCLAAHHASLVNEPMDDRTTHVNANPALPSDQQSPLFLNSQSSYGSGFATLGPPFPAVVGDGGALGTAQGYSDAGGNGIQSSGVNNVGCAVSLDVMVAIEAGDAAVNSASERRYTRRKNPRQYASPLHGVSIYTSLHYDAFVAAVLRTH